MTQPIEEKQKLDFITEHLKSLKRVKNMPVSKELYIENLYIEDVEFLLTLLTPPVEPFVSKSVTKRLAIQKGEPFPEEPIGDWLKEFREKFTYLQGEKRQFKHYSAISVDDVEKFISLGSVILEKELKCVEHVNIEEY